MDELRRFLARATSWRVVAELLVGVGAGTIMLLMVAAGGALMRAAPELIFTAMMTQPTPAPETDLDSRDPLVSCTVSTDHIHCIREAS